jgi:hypothetical protein
VASIFIERGLRGESLVSFWHGRYRSMLYVDVGDVQGLLWLTLWGFSRRWSRRRVVAL